MSPHPPDPFRQFDMEAVTVAERRASFVSAGMPPASVDLMMGAWLAVAGWLNALPESVPQLNCPYGLFCVSFDGHSMHPLSADCAPKAAGFQGGTDGGLSAGRPPMAGRH